MSNTYYVYIYFSALPSNRGQPIYIGKGRGDRCYSHLRGSTVKRLNETIDRHKQIGVFPTIRKVADHLTEDDALDLESLLIKTIGKLCDETGSLLNLTDGGETGRSGPHEKETIDKIRLSLKNQFATNADRKRHGERTRFGMKRPDVVSRLKECNTGENNPFFGKKHQSDSRSKIRDYAKTARIVVSETGERKKVRKDQVMEMMSKGWSPVNKDWEK
jgi:hypothetical protein